jgi:hypothetical protein
MVASACLTITYISSMCERWALRDDHRSSSSASISGGALASMAAQISGYFDRGDGQGQPGPGLAHPFFVGDADSWAASVASRKVISVTERESSICWTATRSMPRS